MDKRPARIRGRKTKGHQAPHFAAARQVVAGLKPQRRCSTGQAREEAHAPPDRSSVDPAGCEHIPVLCRSPPDAPIRDKLNPRPINALPAFHDRGRFSTGPAFDRSIRPKDHVAVRQDAAWPVDPLVPNDAVVGRGSGSHPGGNIGRQKRTSKTLPNSEHDPQHRARDVTGSNFQQEKQRCGGESVWGSGKWGVGVGVGMGVGVIRSRHATGTAARCTRRQTERSPHHPRIHRR